MSICCHLRYSIAGVGEKRKLTEKEPIPQGQVVKGEQFVATNSGEFNSKWL